ncbi:hypothetical protein PR048_033187 [Dryococelus australis]|uniref:Uncharacterized protein n=1 Tax=Dryococelus australis TaxID=614101 RepID=A0ABQ9G0T5_9NEOP|nr:hypothetical protein PR048_033187 [Dryococelus australis]
MVQQFSVSILDPISDRVSNDDGATGGAAVAERLACSPPTKVIRVQSLAGPLRDFRVRESCRTMPLVGGSSRGSPVSPALSIWRCSLLTSITLIGSQDLDVKAWPHIRPPRLGMAQGVLLVGSTAAPLSRHICQRLSHPPPPADCEPGSHGHTAHTPNHYTSSTLIDFSRLNLKQGFQNCSLYREQPIPVSTCDYLRHPRLQLIYFHPLGHSGPTGDRSIATEPLRPHLRSLYPLGDCDSTWDRSSHWASKIEKFWYTCDTENRKVASNRERIISCSRNDPGSRCHSNTDASLPGLGIMPHCTRALPVGYVWDRPICVFCACAQHQHRPTPHYQYCCQSRMVRTVAPFENNGVAKKKSQNKNGITLTEVVCEGVKRFRRQRVRSSDGSFVNESFKTNDSLSRATRELLFGESNHS